MIRQESAISIAELFREKGLKNILIPGFGYGRNAKIFCDYGMNVTGIEISETAIEIAENHYGKKMKVYHGSVGAMPFDQEIFDGIFCYGLLHLLNVRERVKLIKDCFNQLRIGGNMVFITISKSDSNYGSGKKISKDRFDMAHGVKLFFYDSDTIEKEFGRYGLTEAKMLDESINNPGNRHNRKFWQITCVRG